MKKDKNQIKSITIKGFKSICSEQKIEFSPLTVLAGANSSGKSSIMQPLLLLKQTIEAPSDPGALLLEGDNVRFTSAEQLLSKIQGKQCRSDFSIEIYLENESSLKINFKKEIQKGFDVNSMLYKGKDRAIELTKELTHEQILKELPKGFNDFYNRTFRKENGNVKWQVYRERCFLAYELIDTHTGQKPISFGPYGLSPSIEFIPLIQNLIHLPGLRGNPERTYQKSSSGPLFPGTFENYVANIILEWQLENGSNNLKELGKALEKMGLTWKVKADPIGDTKVELKVGRLSHPVKGGAHDLVWILQMWALEFPIIAGSGALPHCRKTGSDGVASNNRRYIYIRKPSVV